MISHNIVCVQNIYKSKYDLIKLIQYLKFYKFVQHTLKREILLEAITLIVIKYSDCLRHSGRSWPRCKWLARRTSVLGISRYRSRKWKIGKRYWVLARISYREVHAIYVNSTATPPEVDTSRDASDASRVPPRSSSTRRSTQLRSLIFQCFCYVRRWRHGNSAEIDTGTRHGCIYILLPLYL